MATYIVDSAAKKSDKPDKGYGPMQVIALALRASDGEVKHVEWYTKAATPLPAPGSQIEGDVTPGQYGLNFKKASGGGVGGPRPEDPKRSAAILRMHSQEMALRWMAIQAQRGAVRDDFTYEGLTKVIDWFDADANQAKDAA